MPRDCARRDLYGRVTDAIVADLEAGVRPWTKPWSAGGRSGPVSRPLRAGGQPYSGVNVLLLWSEALAQGFAAPTWMTFRQAAALGAMVRRGEHAPRSSMPTASAAPRIAAAGRSSARSRS